MAEHAIQVTIGAKDEATKQIKAIDKQLAALTKQKTTIAVDLSTDDAKKQLADVTKQIEQLQSEKAEIVVEANVNSALQALDDVADEATKTKVAVQKLSDAMGADLAAGADVEAIVRDFKRLGLSLDDIIANADRLGGKLSEVGGRIGTGNLDSTLRRSRQGVDDLGKSADSSRSALANMIGNSAQDMGSFAGVTGSAGVAIGQMAEYMADASLSGQKFGAVVANFAKVAGPIAALATVLSVVQGVMATNEERAAAAAAATEKYGEALASSANDAVGLAAALRSNTAEMVEFSGAATETGDILKEVASNIPLIGSLFADAPVDVLAVLNEMDVGFFQLGKAINGNVFEWNKLQAQLESFRDLGLITGDQFTQTTRFINEQRDAVKNAEKAQQFQNIALGEAADLYDEIVKKKKPLGEFPELWDTVTEAITNGTLASEDATEAINRLHFELGLSPGDVLKLAMDQLTDKAKEMSEAFKKSGDDLEDWADRTAKAFEDANEAFMDIGTAQGALDEMSNVFKQMERDAQGLGLAFDLKNAPLDALGEVKDFEDGLRDLHKFINDPKGLKGAIPNIFDPNDVNAGAFLSKIESMRGSVQQAITDAFATGGAGKAQQTADAYVKQFVGAMKGKVKASDIETLWGLDDLQATLKVAVDQASMVEAQAMLDILTNLTGETAWTAQLKFDLISGNIDANTAKELITRQVKPFGIQVNTDLLAPDAKSRSAAKAAADRWAAQAPNKISMGTVVSEPGVAALVDARNKGQDDAKKIAPIVFASTVAAPTVRRFDAGGTVGGYGGIAGERRPEIINDRFLLTGPTYVPPGTRVTSGARTARILRTRGTRGLRAYDSGGTVPMGPVTVNFNGVGQIGNRYDLDRQIRRSIQRTTRIYGSR